MDSVDPVDSVDRRSHGPIPRNHRSAAPDAARVARALGFDRESAARRYVEELAEVSPGEPLPPFEAAEVRSRCELLCLPHEDTAEIVDSLPSPHRTPEWWWCVERASARLVADIGAGRAPRGTWPDFAGGAEMDATRRCHFLHVALSVVPHTLEYHRCHGVPGDLAWTLLGDIAHHAGIHRQVHGATGMNVPWWVTITLCGELVQLGRLQYHRYRIREGDESPPWFARREADRRGDGFRAHDECLAVHIPAVGPLEPAAVDDSFRSAAAFFARHYPPPAGQRRRIATCRSWLLDPQLRNYLPAQSRILSFQRRFEPVPGSEEPGDGHVLEFVFRKGPGTPLAALPRDTTLERAVLDHLEAGGHWYSCTGWLELPPP